MMKNSLTSLYPQLKSWERIRLLLAADARHDEVEYLRLFDASPIRTWYFSEHLLAEQALHVLTLTFVNEQLDAVACLFFALFQLSHHHEQSAELEFLADCSAYFFNINAQAWKTFCHKIQVDPENLIASNHQGWILSLCATHISDLVPTQEELTKHSLPGQLVTAEDLSTRWLKQLQNMTQSTPWDFQEAQHETT